MRGHVRDMLFDYISGEVSGDETAAIEKHIAHCAACRDDLRMLREAVGLLPRRGTPPSEERDAQFWVSFFSRVEERIDAPGKSRKPLMAGATERIGSFVHFNGAHLLAGSGALALVALAAFLFWPQPAPESGPAAEGTAVPRTVTLEPAGVELHDYLKRSRALLAGVSNLRTDGDTPIDLSVERHQSRELVHEARNLKTQTLDTRSARLVGDLEKILIALANSDERNDAPDVEIIRSGLRRNNLLFKMRMTESALAAAHYERNPQ